jgi:hypothetical protein
MQGRTRDEQSGLVRGAGALVAAAALLALNASLATAAITPTTSDGAGATAIANTLPANPATVTGASYDAVPPSGTPNGTADSALAGFPTEGSAFGILTNGNVSLADDPNDDEGSGEDNGGGNVRGTSDFDVTILKVSLDVPSETNCLGIDLRFLSEEFPEFVGGTVSDSFVAEVDTSDWTTTGGGDPPTAPNNFAFDTDGNPISINSTGSTGMSEAEAAGTTYDGATGLLSANSQITPGSHTLYLSIFDQGDEVLDSAVFLDNLRFTQVENPAEECEAGAVPADGVGTTSARGTDPDAALGDGTVAAQYSAITNCDEVQSMRPFYVRWSEGSTSFLFKKSSVATSTCTSSGGANVNEGTASGLINGSTPADVSWHFADGGGPDDVQITVTPDSGDELTIAGAPQPWNGSPGGVWVFGDLPWPAGT